MGCGGGGAGGHWEEGFSQLPFGQDTTSSDLAGQSLPHFHYLSLTSLLLPKSSQFFATTVSGASQHLGHPSPLPPLPLPVLGRCLRVDPQEAFLTR